MSEITSNSLQAGGVGSTFQSIDLNNEKDRGLVRTAMKWWPGRWRGLSDTVKDEMAATLRQANQVMAVALATDSQNAYQAVSAIASIVRTAVMMEGQNQTDYWNNDKNERLDSGKATERLGVSDIVTRRPVMVDPTAIPEATDASEGVSEPVPISEQGIGQNDKSLP